MNQRLSAKNTPQQGFTIVEAIVTIVVVSIFVGYLFQLFLVTESQRVFMQRRDVATHLAMSNLDKITSMSQIPTGSGTDASGNTVPYKCDTASHSNDLTVTPTATGADLITGGVVTGENLSTLGGNTRQSLRITYPRGCDMPARIQASVTYGTGASAETVIHVGYVN